MMTFSFTKRLNSGHWVPQPQPQLVTGSIEGDDGDDGDDNETDDTDGTDGGDDTDDGDDEINESTSSRNKSGND